MACCLPTCAQGSSVPVTGIVGNGVFFGFLAFLASPWCLVHMGGASFASLSVYIAWVT